MFLELIKGHSGIHRNTIADHMQVALFKVDDPDAVPVSNIRITNIPLQRNSPVKDLRTTGDFQHIQGDVPLNGS